VHEKICRGNLSSLNSVMSMQQESMIHLSKEQYDRCLRFALYFVDQHGSIRNRQMREVIADCHHYEEATRARAISEYGAERFFNRAIEDKHLVRKGKGSDTYYVRGIAK
jgi:hypothetical protein